jgi:hypothetical protein
MHVQEMTHAVPCTVSIIKPIEPKILPCKRIELVARRLLGEDGLINIDVAL